MKHKEVFEDIEQEGNFLVYGARGVMEAILFLEREYPETRKVFAASDGREVATYKCLDCGSYWISDDVCGECGEYRLSKRAKYCFYFEKK